VVSVLVTMRQWQLLSCLTVVTRKKIKHVLLLKKAGFYQPFLLL
jgi:hypothetical protein